MQFINFFTIVVSGLIGFADETTDIYFAVKIDCRDKVYK